MKRNPRFSELSHQRSMLKSAGRFREAIRFQLEIIEILEVEDSSMDELSNAHNMASCLYLGAKLYSSAEWHGRKALALRTDGDTPKGREVLGAYNIVLSRILAAQYRFDEAAGFGDIAIKEYGFWHNPPDDYLRAIMAEVEQMRNRTWGPPP